MVLLQPFPGLMQTQEFFLASFKETDEFHLVKDEGRRERVSIFY